MSEQEIRSGWEGATAMASLNRKLYIIVGDTLYSVTAEGDLAKVSNRDWSGATLMTALNDSLWIIHASTLYRVDPQ